MVAFTLMKDVVAMSQCCDVTSPRPVGNKQLVEELNAFYHWFSHLSAIPFTTPDGCAVPEPPARYSTAVDQLVAKCGQNHL